MKRNSVIGMTMSAASVAMQWLQAGITAIPDGDNWCIVQLREKLAATAVRGKHHDPWHE